MGQGLLAPCSLPAWGRAGGSAPPRLALHPVGRTWGRVPHERSPRGVISHPVLLRHPQCGDRDAPLQIFPEGDPRSRSFPASSPVPTPPARFVVFGLLGHRPGGSSPPPAPLRAAVLLAPALPSPATHRRRAHRSPAAEHGQARCMRWHTRLKPGVGVKPQALLAILIAFSQYLPPSPHNEGQGAEGHLVSCHQISTVWGFFFPSSCPSNPSSPYPAAPRPGGQRDVWVPGRGSPELTPPAAASQQSPAICPAQKGRRSRRLPPGRAGK